jgi:hypothetical protein
MEKLDEGGIKRVSFGPDFNVNDTHLAAICCRPDLASSLVSLSLGDSDSGNGAGLTDHGVIVLVRACPNLRELTLNAATKLTDENIFSDLRSLSVDRGFVHYGQQQSQRKANERLLKEAY